MTYNILRSPSLKNKAITIITVTIIIVTLFLAWVAVSSVQASYNWPIAPVNQQHYIVGTFGEYRGDVFHTGVDIKATEGTPVLAVDSGEVIYYGVEAVIVGNKRYVHVKNRVPNGTKVKANDTIAEVRDFGQPGPAQDHLHFMHAGSDYFLNPLSIGGLTPFTDTAAPFVYWIEAVQNGGAVFFTPYIYGRVDLNSEASDAITNGATYVGVHKIGYSIENAETHDVIEDWIYNIIFYENPPDANINSCYAPGSAHWAEPGGPNYIYIVTNDPFATANPDQDYYWNTKQKAGAAKNIDATSNLEARFPDDEYSILVKAWDISGNDDEDSITKRVDNFPPNINSKTPPDGTTDVPWGTDITVIFTERMNQGSVEDDFTIAGGGQTIDKTGGSFSWTVTTIDGARVDTMVFNPTNDLKPDTEYEVKITTSAKDLADKTLDGDADGTSEGSPTDDYSWTFTTAKYPFSVEPDDLDFSVKPGDEPASKSIELKNDGDKQITEISGKRTGDAAGWLSYTAPTSIPPYSSAGGSVSVSVPLDTPQGTYTAKLNFTGKVDPDGTPVMVTVWAVIHVSVSVVPEFPLGVEVATGIGLMVAVVYIWLRKRKTKPTVAKRFTTKRPNLDSC